MSPYPPVDERPALLTPDEYMTLLVERAREADEAEAERDALRETVGRVQALVDSNPDHADTCGSVLTPGADYPCSCWQTDLRAALATTGEGQ